MWDCEIITGSHSGNQVFIPKLKLAPSDANLPFTLQLIQFPIHLSYSMTINKYYRKTFDRVGIYLCDPIFYVALHELGLSMELKYY